MLCVSACAWQGVWPEELGGKPWGEPGPHTQEWNALLLEDVTPLWPDPEDPTKASGSQAFATSIHMILVHTLVDLSA